MSVERYALCLSAALLGASVARAASFTYTDVTPTNASVAYVNGLNDSDIVTGGTQGGFAVGFWWANGVSNFADGTSNLEHINDSGIAAAEPTSRGGGFAAFDTATGKLKTYVLPPPNKEAFSQFIDAADTLTGEAEVKKGVLAAYAIDSSGTIIALAPPGSSDCHVSAVSLSGTIVGGCLDGKTASPASFIYANGSYTTLKLPGATVLRVDFVTNDDLMGGIYSKGSKSGYFLYSNGAFTLFSPKVKGHALPFNLVGQGPDGEIAGTYCLKSGGLDCRGFIYLPSTGQSYTISYPNAAGTYLVGVNALGSVAGSYTGRGGNNARGFIAQCSGGGVCTE